MSEWIALTAFTPDYEWEANRLKGSADSSGVELVMRRLIDKGWRENCEATVKLVLDALNEFKKPVLWLDADSIIIQYPTLINYKALVVYPPEKICDIAIYKRRNTSQYKLRHKTERDTHYETGTIFYNYTQTMMDFLTHQIELLTNYQGNRNMHIAEYPSTDHLLSLPDCPLKIYHLPVEYAFPLGVRQPEEQSESPVILQDMVGSRKKKERGLWQSRG